MTLDPQQAAALEALQTGCSAFLTGSAGTGKSTVTTAFMGSSLKKIDVAATTGIAALNLRDQYASMAGGRSVNVMTIYRWLGIGLGPTEGQPAADFYAWWRGNWSKSKMIACQRMCQAECLVIDEISMLPGRLLSYMDFHLSQVRGNAAPFGGLQIVAVGDFLQLPPVDKSGVGYDWAFWSPAWEGITPIMLEKVHRQADPVFAGLLNQFRRGVLSRDGVEVVASRVRPFCESRIPRLFTHNAAVDKWNSAMLADLPGDVAVFKARLNGDNEDQRKWLIRNLITPYELVLKVGASVMITMNLLDKDGEIVASNGTLATVVSMTDFTVDVQTVDGNLIELRPNCWQYDQQDDNSARFYQIPLRLAWASTIHKSQGLTLKEAWIDIRSAREPGQAYVALSRVKSLNGLHLKALPSGIFTSPAAVAFYDQIKSALIKTTPKQTTYLY